MWTRVVERLVGGRIEERVALAVREALKANDAAWSAMVDRSAGPADRPWHEQQEALADALEAWRVNALARRIVGLTTDYVVGAGIGVASSTPWVDEWVQRFWSHPKNRMATRALWFCDELTRSGELFPVLSTNAVDGMSYVRAVPARQIDQIETLDGDYETALSFHQVDARGLALAGRTWIAFDHPDRELVARSAQVMLHLAVNRPVGATRGAGDLDPVLKWLKRYNAFLEARLALNLHASAFVYDVTLKGATPEQLHKRKSELAQPPAAGSVLVHGDDESWTVNRPQIAGWDASPDGKALVGMIGAGSATPSHWLNSLESGSTQATAAEMGGPALRHYENRQQVFGGFLLDLTYAALEQARARGALRHRGHEVQRPLERDEYGLSLRVAEMAKADNLQLAQAAKAIVDSFGRLHDKGLIDDAALVDLAYRFAGELVDVERVLGRARERS
ncbi:MAG: hypothetical protein AVDCRST_MAG26-4219 [uncultured Chloroflexia bacterium]|uniref:Phage portal protein n=1 Tax=uncultured Chloroflexia bacterium TaxID=1672391 RepID=A0A6J4K1M5_9CHLR|nr:MAG: hypothetical protein AVDCRST_MAG26-4219 [uncultured Chloroflexia bacterium]